MSSPRIAIIGASIVGAACTILLHRAGFDVKTFEKRKQGVAEDRGVGLGFPQELLAQLKEQQLLDADFESFVIEHREYYAYDKLTNQEHLLMDQQSHIHTLNWAMLHQQLIKRVSPALINYEYNLIKIERDGAAVILYFENSEILEFDYVIFADGSQSLGRSFMFPDVMPEFTGYIAWRSAVILKEANEVQRLIHRQPLYGYSRGVAFAYLIPSKDKNDFTVNCLIYDKITDDHPLFSNNANQADKNIPAHLLPKSYLEYYNKMVDTEFPEFPRKLFSHNAPFIQTIRDTLINNYYMDKVALIGDASTLLQPLTGSGAAKGLQDALALVKQLQENLDIHQDFSVWGKAQAKAALHLFELGKQFSDFFVMNTPDWPMVTGEEVQARWNAITENANWYIVKDKKME